MLAHRGYRAVMTASSPALGELAEVFVSVRRVLGQYYTMMLGRLGGHIALLTIGPD